jgi:hypothetical protein
MELHIYKYTECQLLQLLVGQGTMPEMSPFPYLSIKQCDRSERCKRGSYFPVKLELRNWAKKARIPVSSFYPHQVQQCTSVIIAAVNSHNSVKEL